MIMPEGARGMMYFPGARRLTAEKNRADWSSSSNLSLAAKSKCGRHCSDGWRSRVRECFSQVGVRL